MKALFCTELTIKNEDEIPIDIIRGLGLHIICRTGILTHIPIEGVVLHLEHDIDPTYFISLLACSWLKKIRYLRIWKNDREICTIHDDKINIKSNSFSYLRKEEFLIKYYKKISCDDNGKIIFTEPPLEVRDYFTSGIMPNRLIFVTPEYLSRIGNYNKSVCYRNCIVTSIWLLYFIASNNRRKIMEDGRPIFKWNNAWYTLTDILQTIYFNISNGREIRYITDEETKYVDSMYLECLSMDILCLGRSCKAHP